MKKYTEEQIEKAFINWEIKLRCQPNEFCKEKEVKKLSVEEVGKEMLRTFKEHMG